MLRELNTLFCIQTLFIRLNQLGLVVWWLEPALIILLLFMLVVELLKFCHVFLNFADSLVTVNRCNNFDWLIYFSLDEILHDHELERLIIR